MITSSITLTPHEQLAISLLQNRPDLFSKVTKNGNTVDLNDVLAFYEGLVRHLQLAKSRRRVDYIDIEARKEQPA